MTTLADIRSTLNTIRDPNARKVLARLIDVLATVGLDEYLAKLAHPAVTVDPVPVEVVIPKEQIEAALATVKDKVDDLMDDGVLNESNKKKTRKVKK